MCCLGLTSLKRFKERGGREGGGGGRGCQCNPIRRCHWLVEAPSIYNAHKKKKKKVREHQPFLTETSQEHCTHAHRDTHTHTHIIAIHDALFPFWSDCNNYTLYFLLIKMKLKTWKVKTKTISRLEVLHAWKTVTFLNSCHVCPNNTSMPPQSFHPSFIVI